MTATNVFNLDSFRKKKATNIFSSHYEETYKIIFTLRGMVELVKIGNIWYLNNSKFS